MRTCPHDNTHRVLSWGHYNNTNCVLSWRHYNNTNCVLSWGHYNNTNCVLSWGHYNNTNCVLSWGHYNNLECYLKHNLNQQIEEQTIVTGVPAHMKGLGEACGYVQRRLKKFSHTIHALWWRALDVKNLPYERHRIFFSATPRLPVSASDEGTTRWKLCEWDTCPPRV